ncbi:MAG: HDOD domain-containing protein [Planctomycetes bacterium]|nr:HDOD domain-containing protein [Planctomycetota bacterium]
MNADVLEAIKKSAAVPSMPQVIVRFLEVIQDPSFEYTELVKVLSVDPGTVSDLLRLTNSALFGVRREVTNLRHALTLLGPRRTRSMVLGRYLVATLGDDVSHGLDLSYFWRRSLSSAVLATRFASVVAPRLRDEAFISGLLADIGIPILAEAFPTPYAELAGRYAPRTKPFDCADELKAVGVTHAEVSAMVLDDWGLPDLICNAVRRHHSAPEPDDDAAILSRILGATDRLAVVLCEAPDPETVGQVCVEATDAIGMDLKVFYDLLGDIENDIEELASTLRIDVISSTVYALIAKTIQGKLEVTSAG